MPVDGRIEKHPLQWAGFRLLPLVSDPIEKSSQSYEATPAALPWLLPDEIW